MRRGVVGALLVPCREVLKRPELQAYHQEFPDFLSAIFGFLLEQPCLFELVSQQYLNNSEARQVASELSGGMKKAPLGSHLDPWESTSSPNFVCLNMLEL